MVSKIQIKFNEIISLENRFTMQLITKVLRFKMSLSFELCRKNNDISLPCYIFSSFSLLSAAIVFLVFAARITVPHNV